MAEDDRTVKLPLYAAAGIDAVWILDLTRRVLEAHRAPAGDGYDEMATDRQGDRLSFAVTPDIALTPDVVFG